MGVWAAGAVTAGSAPVEARTTPSATWQQEAPAEQTRRAKQLFVRGMTKAEVGAYAEAIRLYEEALTHRPGAPAILSALADAEAKQNDLESAIFSAEQAHTAAPTNRHYALQLARFQREAERHEAAATTLRTWLSSSPDDTQVRVLLARTLADAGQPRAAIELYEQVIESAGPSAELWLDMLRLYREIGDAGGRERALQALTELRPQELTFVYMLGSFYKEQDRLQDAAALYEAALERHPGQAELLTKLAATYRQLGNAARSEALMDRLGATDDASADQLVSRAVSFAERAAQDPEAAQTAQRLLEAALERDSSHTKALRMLGDLHYRRGEYAEAAPLLQRAVEENPRAPQRWAQAAAAYLQADQPREAVAVAEEGRLLFPQQLPLVRVEAFGLMRIGRNRDAIARFRQVLSLTDSTTDAAQRASFHAALGLLYSRVNVPDSSDRAYEEALALDADQRMALNNYAYSLAQRGEKLERALSLAQRAVELEPKNAAFLDTLGWVLFKLDRFDEAQTYIQRAIDTGDASASVYEHLGDVYHAQGDQAAARRYWQKALDQAPGRDRLRKKLDAL